MRKIYFIGGGLALIVAAVLLFGSRYGLKIGGLSLAFDKDRQALEARTKKFWEDIQFKDFKAAAKYHARTTQKKRDIPFLLERLFMVKPEQLDIRAIDVQQVHIDSTGKRGRSRTRLTVKILRPKQVKHQEVMLYWYKRDGQWLMRLESSLRRLKAKK